MNDPTKPDKPSPVFIHSALDEAGLTPSEFRIFCHVARRGECFAAIETIAEICRLSKDTVRAGLKSLAMQSFLIRQPREGQTTVHKVAPIASWNPSHKILPLRKDSRGIKHNPTPMKRQQAHPSENMVGEVTPIEVNPTEVNPKSNLPFEISIPKRLNKPEFLAAWKDWLTHRSQIKKPVNELQAQKELEKQNKWAARHGLEKIIESINAAIAAGGSWIYEPKAKFEKDESDGVAF